ncbi:MAG: threonyl-tRNA synthetase editing domain-containing protein [Candidatus Asgardarchaeia archaeon]
MKLLMFHALEFWYKTSRKNLPSTEDITEEKGFENASLIFIHTESKDENNENHVLRKALKNILWHMRKVNSDKIILHSFAHLSSDKSSPEFAMRAINWLEEKIKERNIPVFKTPFGYFLEIKLHISGESLGRVFKDL